MKTLWLKLTARINAMTVRERFLLFASVIAVLGLITEIFFISPLLDKQKVLVAQIDKKSSEMDLQREETNLEMLKRGRDNVKELNVGLLKVQEDISAVENEIALLSTSGVDAVAVSAMLRRVLRHSEKVGLVRVVQVAPEMTPNASAPVQSTNHTGLDITLSGSYLDLMEYLAFLEREMPQARWGAFLLKADALPAQLTVRIVTSGGDS